MGRRRKRKAFSTAGGRRVFAEARRQRGFDADLAERTHGALLDFIADRPRVRCGLQRGDYVVPDELVQLAGDAIISQLVPGGLVGMLFWAAGKWFIRWLVGRLLQEWEGSWLEFEEVAEEL